MGARATLDETALAVAPGEQASVGLRVRNAGSVVDEFTFEAIGVAAGWTTVQPDVVRLLPGAEEVVQVVIAPPREHLTEPGDHPFGIKVNAKEDPEGSAVEEGTVSIGAFTDLSAEIIPRTSQGSRKGEHEIAVDNRGNGEVDARVSAMDDDELLDFQLSDTQLLLEPGTAAFTTVQARPKERFWRGPNKTMPFRVLVDPQVPEQPPLSVDGTLVQRALLPPWLLKALLALLALLLLLWLLWLFLLRPTIESTASEAADEAASEVAEEVESEAEAAATDAASEAVAAALEEPLAAAEAQAEELAEVTGKVNEVAEIVGEATIAPSPSPTEVEVETNTDLRLAATDTPGPGVGADAFVVPGGSTLRVADVVFQNPRGNIGQARLLRNGEILLVTALENFRDLDYHFVSPIVFEAGDELRFEVQCTTVTATSGPDECDAAAYVSGVNVTEEPAG